MRYEPAFKPSFFKDMAKLPHDVRQRCDLAITQIVEDPFGVAAKKLGGYGQLYRYRLGDYRLVYCVFQRERKITFLLVAHRKDVYRYLKNMCPVSH